MAEDNRKDAAKRHTDTNAMVSLVRFVIDTEEFALPIDEVFHIERVPEITKLPNTMDYVSGVINLRGNIIPVFNMRRRFNLAEKKADNETRVVIVGMHNKLNGLIVDVVKQVIRIPEHRIEPPPDVWSGISRDYLKGIVKHEDGLIVMLNLEGVVKEYDDAVQK